MEQNLYQWIKSRDRYIPEHDIRRVTFQILSGLHFMHKQELRVIIYEVERQRDTTFEIRYSEILKITGFLERILIQ